MFKVSNKHICSEEAKLCDVNTDQSQKHCSGPAQSAELSRTLRVGLTESEGRGGTAGVAPSGLSASFPFLCKDNSSCTLTSHVALHLMNAFSLDQV